MTFDPADDPGFPFPDFDSDAAACAKSRLFWQVGFDGALGEERSTGQDWMADPFEAGHPIFSAIDRAARRGVLLRQVRRTDDPARFKSWIPKVAGAGAGDRLSYLFIETFVSNEGRHLFEMPAHRRCAREVDEQAMGELAARIGREAADAEHGSTERLNRPS